MARLLLLLNYGTLFGQEISDLRTSHQAICYWKEHPMISCPKCDNDTRTSGLVTAQGDVMLAGTIGTDPRPILAQVCTACGYIELYAPLTLDQPEARRAAESVATAAPEMGRATA
jgi:predicted nucleic-acid-binding Zn-ribbon protein